MSEDFADGGRKICREAQSSQQTQVIAMSGDLADGERKICGEAQSSQQTQVIEMSGDFPDGGRRICGEAPCVFADAGSISKDSEERSTSMRKLLMAVILCIIFMIGEVVGGIKAYSLAILTDAAHLLSDVAAFAISLFSLWVAGWEVTPRDSYGFFRIEILGALVSIQLIWLLAIILVYEAINRIIAGPKSVNGSLMFLVSAFGLVINIIMAVLLGHDHGHKNGHKHGHSHDDEYHQDDHHSETKKKKQWNINVHGAYLHGLGDSIQSIGIMIGGGVIWYKLEWQIVDITCTLIFSVIVLVTTIKMLRNILEVLMESTSRGIDATKLERGLLDMEDVVDVHELHIWSITVKKVLLSSHVKIRREADVDMMLDKVINYIKGVYNISHVTI